MNILAFPQWDNPYASVVLLPVYHLFEKATEMISAVSSRLQLPSPFILNTQTGAEHNEDTGDFKYNDWSWEELNSFKYLDKLKQQQPETKHLFIFKDYRTIVNLLLKQDFELADAANKQSLLWRLFKRRRALRQLYSEKAGEYLAIWLRYNEEFAANVEKLPKESYVLLDQKKISSDDASVSAFILKNWNLSLKYVRFKQISAPTAAKSNLDIDTFLASLKSNTKVSCEV